MARITHVHTIDEVARRIGENLELIEIVSANSDNIDYGEMIWVDEGTEEGIKTFTDRGIECHWKRSDRRPWCSTSPETPSAAILPVALQEPGALLRAAGSVGHLPDRIQQFQFSPKSVPCLHLNHLVPHDES